MSYSSTHKGLELPILLDSTVCPPLPVVYRSPPPISYSKQLVSLFINSDTAAKTSCANHIQGTVYWLSCCACGPRRGVNRSPLSAYLRGFDLKLHCEIPYCRCFATTGGLPA